MLVTDHERKILKCIQGCARAFSKSFGVIIPTSLHTSRARETVSGGLASVQVDQEF